MPEAGDYFAWLGLTPGVYSERDQADRPGDLRARQPEAGAAADAPPAAAAFRDPGPLSGRLRSTATHADAPAPTGEDVESAFVAVVASLLEAGSGVLRYSNRCKLLDLAARMGLPAFEANLLIERTRFRATGMAAWLSPADPPADAPASAPLPSLPAPSARRRRWILAIALAVLLDAAVILLLLW